MSDFPDYEAAQRAQDAGRAAVSIVKVALGDKVLFEKCEHSEFTHNGRIRRLAFDNGKHHVTFDETPDHSCYECRDGRHRKYEGWYCNGWVQMWPKED